MTFNNSKDNNAIGFMICTRNRPLMLKDCLLSVLKQIQQAKGEDFVVVIENNNESTCHDMVAELSQNFPNIPIHYILEPNLGIPFARQTGVNFALSKGPDWIAFIDDDEELEANWLTAMRKAMLEFDCEIITGPVRYLYPDGTPNWLKAPTKKNIRGASRTVAATNNTLLRADWYSDLDEKPQFDPQFRFTGGSDTDFFYALTDIGGRVRWVDDAIVSETVSDVRLTMSYQLRRDHSIGANNMTILCKRKGLAYAIRRHGFKSLYRAMRAIIKIAKYQFYLNRKAEYRFKARKTLATNIGNLTGLLNWLDLLKRPPQPYLETTGR